VTEKCPHGRPFDASKPWQPNWCRTCWRAAGGKVGAVPERRPLPVCVHRGDEVPPSRGRRRFDCVHPDAPLGNPVCPCDGCGPKCPGYSPESGVETGEPPAYKPTRPRVVCTVAVGDSGAAMLKATRPMLEAYAAKVGADFVAVTGEPLNPHYPVADKFRLHHLTPHWDRLLFVDVDALVHPDAPDLFAAVPPGTVGIRDDAGEITATAAIRSAMEQTCRSQGVARVESDLVLNSGVVVWDRDQPVWTPPFYPLPPTSHVAEQCWVQHNVLSRGLSVTSLSRRWNHQWWSDRDLDAAADEPPYILHLAGMSQMRQVPGWNLDPTRVRSVVLTAAAWAARRLT
jgi:hypothetical protein